MSSITYILASLLVLQASGVLSSSISTRISGGKDAFPGEYPYQVAIQYGVPPLVKYRSVCGGALLSASWVLTSASCLTLIPKVGKIQVQVGKHELDKDGEWVQAVQARLRLVHSGYKTNLLGAVKPNDIALLKLKTPLELNARVQPVALPTDKLKPSGEGIVTGWGSVSMNLIPKLPKVLQEANVTILSEDNCNDALRSVSDNEKIVESQFCTGPLTGEISACLGDLGDPLVQVVNNSAVLIGVASWSPYPCGQPGSPTIYTQVSSFLEWLRERIQEN